MFNDNGETKIYRRDEMTSDPIKFEEVLTRNKKEFVEALGSCFINEDRGELRAGLVFGKLQPVGYLKNSTNAFMAFGSPEDIKEAITVGLVENNDMFTLVSEAVKKAFLIKLVSNPVGKEEKLKLIRDAIDKIKKGL